MNNKPEDIIDVIKKTWQNEELPEILGDEEHLATLQEDSEELKKAVIDMRNDLEPELTTIYKGNKVMIEYILGMTEEELRYRYKTKMNDQYVNALVGMDDE